MKQDQDPTDQVAPIVAPDPIDQVRRRHLGSTTMGLRKPELKLTSMIDVVFLLLIFFVVTASFQIDEGSLLATMPGNTVRPPFSEPPPTPDQVDLISSDDGVRCRLLVDGVQIDGASALSALMTTRVATGQMASGDFVKITPQGEVRWQHVLNVYNACVTAELDQVAFAY